MKRKSIVAIAALVLLLVGAVGGTLAWMSAQTRPVTNTFEAGEVTTWVNETFDGKAKKNVSIQNTGTIPAYIRAAVVINWADKDGNVSGTPVKSGDYTAFSPGTNWEQGTDGYYYYTQPVPAGGSTDVLIPSIAPQVTPPAGYDLQVTILAEGIQAMPETAIQEAWGVYPSNNWSTWPAAQEPPATPEQEVTDR